MKSAVARRLLLASTRDEEGNLSISGNTESGPTFEGSFSSNLVAMDTSLEDLRAAGLITSEDKASYKVFLDEEKLQGIAGISRAELLASRGFSDESSLATGRQN